MAALKTLGLCFSGQDLLLARVEATRQGYAYELGRVADFLTREPAEIQAELRLPRAYLRHAVLSWPREWAMVRQVDVPAIDPAEFRTALASQLDNYFPVQSEDAYFDVHFSQEPGGRAKALICVVNKELLDPVVERLGQAGVELRRVVLSSLALEPLAKEAAEPTAFVSRSGGRQFTIDIGGEHGMSSYLSAADESDAAQQIERAGAPAAVCLLPQGEAAQSLIERLGGEAKASLLDPAYEAAGAAIADITGSEQAGLSVPLPRPRRVAGAQLVCGALVVALLAALAAFPALTSRRQARILRQTEREIAKLSATAVKIETAEKQIKSQSFALYMLNELTTRLVPRLDVLLELVRILPKDAWIKELSIEGNELTIQGQADSAANLVPVLEASPLFKEVAMSSPVTRKTGKKKETFRIHGTLCHVEASRQVRKPGS